MPHRLSPTLASSPSLTITLLMTPGLAHRALSRRLFSASIRPSNRFQVRTMASLPADRRPIVISGPSGVGKGTLYKMLFDRHPETFALSVSHTTRGPRPGETDGVDYHFVPMQTFEDLIAEGGFVEHAKFGGNRYGTSKRTIEEQSSKGKVVVLDIEMEVCSHSPLAYTLHCANPFTGCQAD